MFKIAKQHIFTEEVKLAVTQEGSTEPPTFSATFRALIDDEVNKHETITPEGQAVFLREVTVSLDGLLGDDDTPLPFTKDLLDDLLGRSYVRMPMLTAYADGLLKARVGN